MALSRYVVKAPSYDGKSNIYFNIRNGKGIKLLRELDEGLKEDITNLPALKPFLAKYKFIRDPHEAEDLHKENIQAKIQSPFHLIIMPHQNCNFRCVYCYEKFEKNKMTPAIEQALVRFVQNRLQSKKDKVFSVSWFGGEPLLATDVIERLSQKFIEFSKENNVNYVAGITTNGFSLNKKNIDILLKSGVKHFQVTLDGTKECHDHQRVMVGGQPTYDKIINNLKELSERKEPFKVVIRMNVGINNQRYAEDHIKEMKAIFGGDKRFVLYFHNIEHWGGDNDSEVGICSENMTIKLLKMTLDKKMNVDMDAIKITPNSTCYAASENSFVIGVDGMVYKCTVALYDELNHVGYLRENGELDLNTEKMQLWTQSGINDNGCKECFFAPSCHGDSCPLIRLKKGIRPCPDQKGQIEDYITLMDRQGIQFTKVRKKVGV